MLNTSGQRPWTFYVLAAFFVVYVLFLYGPMICIFILSFQGPQGGAGLSHARRKLHWFYQIWARPRPATFPAR